MLSLLRTPKNPDSITISYLTMRKVIGWMGFLLVPVLIIGTLLLDHKDAIKVSVSAYYYSHTRNILVGALCGISLFLFSYHGYSWKDSLASKVAGLFALGIAFFPTSETNDKTDPISIIHYIAAGVFFITLSYISYFLFTKSSGHITKQKKQRNHIYKVCGIIMILSAAGIPLVKIDFINTYISFLKPVLILETSALASFGFSWLTKGEFLLKDK